MDKEQEYYWSIIIEPEWLHVGVWTIRDSAVQIVASAKPRKWTATEDLVTQADEALSEAVKDFPEDAPEPDKTVFGLPPAWVTEGQVKKDYLEYIRQLCSQLSLKPSGFVVLPEAVAHAMKIEDGAPLTGIIVGIHKSEIDVTLFKLGNLVGTVHVGRSVSIFDDVVEGLARFHSTEGLPSKFILYGGDVDELEEVSQQLIQSDWANLSVENVKVLHTPQVETVDSRKSVSAVSLAGASELENISSIMTEKDEPVEKPEDVGFVTGKDIAETAVPVAASVPNNDNYEDNSEELDALPAKRTLPKLGLKFPSFKSKPSLPVVKLPSIGLGGNKAARIAIPLVILLVVLGIVWWNVPKAEVTIYVAPQILEETTEVSFDTDRSEPDWGSRILPAQVISTTVNGEKTRSATGSKTVGDRATGSVTLRNGTLEEISLSANTVLVGPNGLKFSIDEAVTVPERVSLTAPGEAAVEVTAEDFGSEYNLASGEEFTVGNFPKLEVDGIVEEALSGGSSRDITAVAADDLEVLEDELTAELVEDGASDLQSQVNSNQQFIADSVQLVSSETDFSHKVGDEASNITLSLESTVEGVVVSKEILNMLYAHILNDQVPVGFVLNENQIRMELENIEEDDGVWTAEMRIRANLLPNVDPDVITNRVRGKYPPDAQEILNSIPGYSRAEVRINPRFPSRLGIIPYNSNNISVEIVAER